MKGLKLHQQTPPPEEPDDVPAEGGHGLLIPDDGQEGLRADDPAPNGQQHPQSRVLLLQCRRPGVQT